MKKIDESPNERENQAVDKPQIDASTFMDVNVGAKSHGETTYASMWLECRRRLDQLMCQCYAGMQ